MNCFFSHNSLAIPSARAGRGGAEHRANAFRRDAAFTMIEIAIALAIIAFALVAIIGVLPQGLQVQRHNKEDTIINQEAVFWMEAIRNGITGNNMLTNFVSEVRVENSLDTFAVQPTQEPDVQGWQIIGLLSTPKYVDNPRARRPTAVLTNRVTAHVRALSGSALERSRRLQDFAFRYRLTSEVVPLRTFPTNLLVDPSTISDPQGKQEMQELININRNMETNAYELRLTFQWPLLEDGSTGNGHKVYRSMASGRLINTNNSVYYFFDPLSYSR